MGGQGERYFELNVLGNKLVFRHDSDLETLQVAEKLLKHKVDLVKRDTKARDHLELMIMTALHLVVELMDERSERAMPATISIGDSQAIDQLVTEMLAMLEPFSKSVGNTETAQETLH